MSDQSRTTLAILAGAALGGLAGYLMLTEGGRRVRSRIEPTLEEFLGEINRLGGTVDKARRVANEGWRVLNQMAGDERRLGSMRQQSPF